MLVRRGEKLRMYEFPIAPKSLEDDAVKRTLKAPEKTNEEFHLVLGDALRAPFTAQSFDTVVTPWLIDIIAEDLPVLGARDNRGDVWRNKYALVSVWCLVTDQQSVFSPDRCPRR